MAVALPTHKIPGTHFTSSFAFAPNCSARGTLSLQRKSSFGSSQHLACFSSSFLFAGRLLMPCFNLPLALTQRSTLVKVRAGKAGQACTKRSRSRLSVARVSGFRARLQTPGGRNILRRRRAKGRKVLCPRSNPNSGKRA